MYTCYSYKINELKCFEASGTNQVLFLLTVIHSLKNVNEYLLYLRLDTLTNMVSPLHSETRWNRECHRKRNINSLRLEP